MAGLGQRKSQFLGTGTEQLIREQGETITTHIRVSREQREREGEDYQHLVQAMSAKPRSDEGHDNVCKIVLGARKTGPKASLSHHPFSSS